MTTRQRQLKEAFHQAMSLAGLDYRHNIASGSADDEAYLMDDEIIVPSAEELVGLSPEMAAIQLEVARELFDEFAEEADPDHILVQESPAWRNEQRRERLREAA